VSDPVGPDTLPVPIDVDVDPGTVQVPWGLVVAVLLVVLLVLLALWRTGAGYDFKVKVRGRHVIVTGKRVSAGLRASLVQFFENDFAPKQRLTVYGRRRANRTYELRFHGRVSAGEKQQVRNFLTSGV
jgi:hypothetical protein